MCMMPRTRHVGMGRAVQVVVVARLVGVQRTVQKNGNVKSELVKNLQYMLSTVELLCFCRSHGIYSRLTSFLFFSQSRQPSAAFSTHLCTWLHNIRTL